MAYDEPVIIEARCVGRDREIAAILDRAAASADSRRSRAAAVWPAATTLAGISVAPPAPVFGFPMRQAHHGQGRDAIDGTRLDRVCC